MTIDNIALVRATNVIPFDGVMKPISESFYLRKNRHTSFGYAMNSMLKELGVIDKPTMEEFMDEEKSIEYTRRTGAILDQYIPYTSDYNSMILFSLNGLVPDDSEVGFGNNTFSDKKCAVIDGLSEHIDQVVSLIPTDTAIKGSLKLSNNAIILIEKNYFASLSDEEKKMLVSNNFTVIPFEGDLKTAVKKVLSDTHRFVPETLSLSRIDKGFRESETKEETLNTINQIAASRGIAQVLHFDVITGKNDEKEKLESVKDEHENMLIVEKYYLTSFFEYLFRFINVDGYLKSRVLSNYSSDVYMKELCEVIKEFGIDNYKQIVDSYNKELERKRASGELLTPEEIVALSKEEKHIL